MPKPSVTLKDLARELNLSLSTVSRALQNSETISKKTRKRVLAVADQLGYFPNSMASSLRKSKSNLIGIIVPRISIYFHSRVISGVEEIAFKNGYNVVICQSNDSYEREVANTQALLANRVGGVIACLALETKDNKHFMRFAKFDTPLVFFDRVCQNFACNKVVIDDFKAAYKATQHLINIGCKRIAHVAGYQGTNIFRARLEGYKAALRDNNVQNLDDYIIEIKNLNYTEGYLCLSRLFTLKPPPDGVFCANDDTAVGIIQGAKANGIKVPENCAVVGFSNYPVSTIVEPTLTTIDDRAIEMGQAAAKLLLQQIEDKSDFESSQTIIIETDLIVRNSTNRSGQAS